MSRSISYCIRPSDRVGFFDMIRVMIVDDHHLVRQGLRQLLESEFDIQVVAEAADGQEAVETAGQFRPDVIVMDVEIPGINGIEATGQIRKKHPETQVVMLSMHSDSVLIRQAFEQGARGYVLKKSIGVELINAIHTVCSGVTYHSQSIEQAEQAFEQPPRSTKPQLTLREREVLQLISTGDTNQQIAVTLGISIKTVEIHRSNLMAKLGTHSLTELIRTAIRLGLVE